MGSRYGVLGSWEGVCLCRIRLETWNPGCQRSRSLPGWSEEEGFRVSSSGSSLRDGRGTTMGSQRVDLK